MEIEEKLLIVKRNDFLAQLSAQDFDLLDIAHNVLLAEKNTYIYFDAHHYDKLFFVKEGFIRIGTVDNEGNEFTREILQPGDVFGQVSLERGNLNGEFAQAHKSKAILCSFSIDKFESLLKSRPELAIVFSKKVGQHLRRIENRLLNLLQKDARTRLLHFFWTLAIQNEKQDQDSVVIPNYMTHDDIARLTRTSRQTVTTLISQFSSEGLLEVDRQNITIHDIKLLQKKIKVR